MNRKRLAFSAAIIAGLLYPSWTGSWADFPSAAAAFSVARQRATNYADDAMERQRATFATCKQRNDPANCSLPIGISGPELWFGPIMEGAFAALWRLGGFLFDTLLAGLLAYVAAFFSPVAATSYLRWLKAE